MAVLDTDGCIIIKSLLAAFQKMPEDFCHTYIPVLIKHFTDKRLFYLDDGNGGKKDYTDIMRKYLLQAMFNGTEANGGKLYGLVEVNEELLDILLKITKAYDGFGGITNSWQMMCYYYKTIGNA